MKGERKKYDTITQLPASAQSIANFAKVSGFTVSYIYKKFNEGKADYKIIDFQGYNFVITN